MKKLLTFLLIIFCSVSFSTPEQYKEPIISDEDFAELNDASECLAIISMLVYGECCQQDLNKALSYCLLCIDKYAPTDEEQEENVIYVDHNSFCIFAAQIYMKFGDFEAAQKILERGQEGIDTICVIEGDIALRTGQPEKAYEIYKKAFSDSEFYLPLAQRIYICSQLGLCSLESQKNACLDMPWLVALRINNQYWKERIKEFNPDNTDTVFFWYSYALEDAHLGLPAAMQYLSKVYTHGCKFIKKDKKRAKYWLYNAERISREGLIFNTLDLPSF